MFYGIFIGLIIVGLLLIAGNWRDSGRDHFATKGFTLGLILFLGSLGGFIGLLFEDFL